MKVLRLSHPRFGYLEWILKTFFRSLRFHADPHHIEQLAETDIGLIAPFVDQVNLMAPLHSWTCTLNQFGTNVSSQADQVLHTNQKKLAKQH